MFDYLAGNLFQDLIFSLSGTKLLESSFNGDIYDAKEYGYDPF